MKRFFGIGAFFLLFNFSLFGQVSEFNIGATLGLGGIQSISPTITSLNGSVFIEALPGLWDDFYFRITFLYAQKVEYFLPEDRTNRYYPFIKVFSFKVVNRQKISDAIFIEVGIGPMLLNDHIFGDMNEWNYGAAFSSTAGFDLRGDNKNGFMIGAGIEYGNTFNNSAANYFILFLQTNYFITQ